MWRLILGMNGRIFEPAMPWRPIQPEQPNRALFAIENERARSEDTTANQTRLQVQRQIEQQLFISTYNMFQEFTRLSLRLPRPLALNELEGPTAANVAIALRNETRRTSHGEVNDNDDIQIFCPELRNGPGRVLIYWNHPMPTQPNQLRIYFPSGGIGRVRMERTNTTFSIWRDEESQT